MKKLILILLALTILLFAACENEILPIIADVTIEVTGEAPQLVFTHSEENPDWETLNALISGTGELTMEISSNLDLFITGCYIDDIEYLMNGVWVSKNDNNNLYLSAARLVKPEETQATSITVELESNKITIPDSHASFKVYLSAKFSEWMYLDTDNAGDIFLYDNIEIIKVRGNLGFSGYIADTSEFYGAFPGEVQIEFSLKNNIVFTQTE